MWYLAKSIVGVVVFLALAYAVFFVDLAGKPLAGHFHDVWASEAVQAKVGLVRSSLRNELEDRLAAVAEQQARQAVRQTLGPGPDEITQRDREALDEIIARHE